MFYLKIFLTHLNFRWRLAEIRTNYSCRSHEKFIDVVDIVNNKIELKKKISHGKYTRVWVKKV